MPERPSKKIYFDHGATTRVLPEVVEAMTPYVSEKYGNASSIHSFGREARMAVDSSRARVAVLIGADSSEIVFTSSGTESDNLAIKGVALHKSRGKGHIITTDIEHSAVLEPCAYLKSKGFEVTRLPVSKDGLVDLGDVEAAIKDDTILVSVMMANREIGTIQPVREIGRIAHSRGALFHTDAVQAAGKMSIDVDRDNIDLLSISSHKFHGPKGVGALYVRKGTKVEPLLHGGGHEGGLRSSTENVPGIVGFGKAAEIAQRDMPTTAERMRHLRDRIIKTVPETIPNAYLNGHPTNRLVNNVHLRFDFIEGEGLVLHLDMLGIAASTGSACSTGSLEPSPVLLALGLTHEQAHGSLRVTLGRENNDEEVSYFLEVLPGIVSKLREISPLSNGPKCNRRGGCCVQ
ncbi:MAG: cysteine desulfurase NifS [Thermoplasmata archaeon]